MPSFMVSKATGWASSGSPVATDKMFIRLGSHGGSGKGLLLKPYRSQAEGSGCGYRTEVPLSVQRQSSASQALASWALQPQIHRREPLLWNFSSIDFLIHLAAASQENTVLRRPEGLGVRLAQQVFSLLVMD